MEKLREWIRKKCIKQIGFAREIGISTATMHEILHQDKTPNLKTAYRIEQFTEGEITLYDWVSDMQKNVTIATKTKKVK